jgi:TonB family protein
MKRKSKIAIFLALLIALSVESTKTGFAKDVHFVPPDVLTVSDIPYPFDSVAAGVVTLSVNLDAAGNVQNVLVLRDIPSLTAPAVAAVKNWAFAPGKINGKAVPSTLNLSVLFNPGNLQTQPLTLGPVQPSPPPNPPGYLPPELASVTFVSYPPNSVGAGAVVLDLTIGKSGEIKKSVPIRSVASLTSPSTNALNNWTINAATFQGKAISSKLIIAFVFGVRTS